MSDKKYVVPEGMVMATIQAFNAHTKVRGYQYLVDRYVVEATLEAALRWLSENPIVPSDKQLESIKESFSSSSHFPAPFPTWREQAKWVATEWQRRCFLAPEIPEEIKDLLDPFDPNHQFQHNIGILEAFRRGQKSR